MTLVQLYQVFNAPMLSYNRLDPCGPDCATDPSAPSRQNLDKNLLILRAKYSYVHKQGLAAEQRIKESKFQSSQMSPRTVLCSSAR